MLSLPFPIVEGTRPYPALVINLFGGPSIGKTNLAGRIFLALNDLNLEAANPEEHAKLAIFQGQAHLLDEQLILLGRTWDTLHALGDKVDVIVVDSPLLLASVYGQKREGPHFHATVRDFHSRFSRLNCLLMRNQSLAYSTVGRRENLTQALHMDTRIVDALDTANEPYLALPPTGQATEQVARTIAQAAADWIGKRKSNIMRVS